MLRSFCALFVVAFAAVLPAQAATSDPESAAVLAALVRQNDAEVATLLARVPAANPNPRETARTLKLCAAAYAQPASARHHDPALLATITGFLGTLAKLQNPDGSFDTAFSEGNPQSPPDAGFIIRHLCLAQTVLLADAHAPAAAARDALRQLILRGVEILRVGGVHTPNHRWVVCGALAPSEKNLARIDDGLGEGIDQDADGQFSERSPIYAHASIEPLLDVALLLNRPALLEPVRKSLRVTLLLTEPDGELDATASRRQDQQQRNLGRSVRHLAGYYTQLRHLALIDHDGVFAAAVRMLERDHIGRLTEDLSEWMESPALGAALPPSAPLPDNFARHLANAGLVRIRRGTTTATIFGGSDWAAMHDISSGLSTNPTFFKYRKGAAILESVRLTPGFFNLGYFRSEGLAPAPGGAGWLLHQTMRAAYYQPLPAARRNTRGDYPLTDDGRFYSKMDFPSRPRDEKRLTTRISVRELADAPGAFELDFALDDTPGIAVTIELCFRPGGTLTGVEPHATEPATYFAKTGLARYTVGADTIEFGPGGFGSARISMAGEDYSWRNGQLRAEGVRVYITGVTPFRHRLIIK